MTTNYHSLPYNIFIYQHMSNYSWEYVESRSTPVRSSPVQGVWRTGGPGPGSKWIPVCNPNNYKSRVHAIIMKTTVQPEHTILKSGVVDTLQLTICLLLISPIFSVNIYILISVVFSFFEQILIVMSCQDMVSCM